VRIQKGVGGVMHEAKVLTLVRGWPRRSAHAALTLLAVVALVACGAKKEGAATQVVAKVNDAEITVHEINFRLQQQRDLKPEQVDAASRRILDQLVDQQLAVQKAEQLKLDRDPRVVQALDAARKEVLARALIEQLVQGMPKPTDDAVRRYYDEHPDLFSQRKIYNIVEMVAEVPQDKQGELRARVERGQTAADVLAWMKASGLKYGSQQVTRPAEQVPLELLAELSKLPDGHGSVHTRGGAAKLFFVASSRAAPVSFDQGKAAISQFLANDARRKAIETNIQALKTAAKVQYFGKFADQAASQPALATTQSVDPKAQVEAASGVQVQLPATSASGVTVNLPAAQASGVSVSLPNAPTGGARVSLPTSASSGVEVRLPSTGGVDAEAVRKGLGGK
jgi:EpsD family peptidyl-prolyl cis-trans isomerase